MPGPLTPLAELETLVALADWHTDHHLAPSIQELSWAIGRPRTTTAHRVRVLRDRGLVSWIPAAPRTLVLTDAGRVRVAQSGHLVGEHKAAVNAGDWNRVTSIIQEVNGEVRAS